MSAHITVVLEHTIEGFEEGADRGGALARVIEAHPALTPLLDFESVDPVQTAVAVGMTYAYDADDVADLEEIDFGPGEWFEPAAGLATAYRALAALRADPGSVALAVYDPGLRPEGVIADMEALARVLEWARQHETRFHLVLKS